MGREKSEAIFPASKHGLDIPRRAKVGPQKRVVHSAIVGDDGTLVLERAGEVGNDGGAGRRSSKRPL